MNAYKIMSAGMQKAVEKGYITAEQGAKKCRVYDFLAECDQEDFYALFDSGAFNNIAEGYAVALAKELRDEGEITQKQAERIPRLYRSLYEDYSAKNAYEKMYMYPLEDKIDNAKEESGNAFQVWARYPNREVGEQIGSGSFYDCEEFCLNANLGSFMELNICSNDGRILEWFKTPSGQEFPDGEVCQENAELIPHIDDDSGLH